MANEKQLIEANALIEYLKKLSFEGGTKTRSQAGNEVLHIHMPQIIQQVPTVDAVEVVRCGDCKFRKGTRAAANAWGWNCANPHSPCRGRIVGDAFYCEAGERGDNESAV